MSEHPPWNIRETSVGERPATAGLPPRWRDLVTYTRGKTLEDGLMELFGLHDIEITSTEASALHIALRTLKQMHPQRDVVIVPAYTSPRVVVAAATAGLKVVACDTADGSLDLDLDHLARLVGPQTLAVVPTHYFGHLSDVVAVRRVVGARSPDIAVIEDASQALGGRRDGQSAGTLGDIGVYSLGIGSGLTIGKGGAITTRDARLMRAMREEHHRLWRRDPIGGLGRWIALACHHAVYNPLGVRIVSGWPRRRALRDGDLIGAAGERLEQEVPVLRVGGARKHTGLAALSRLQQHLAASQSRFDALSRRLHLIPRLLVHQPTGGSEPTGLAVHVTLPPSPSAGAFIDALWASRHGISRMFCHAIGDYPELAGLIEPGPMPNARALAQRTITISTAAGLSPSAEDVIVQALTRYVAEASSLR